MIGVHLVNGNTMAGYGLVVYSDDLNQIEFVADVLGSVLGYEQTQAFNCAHVIYTRGEYLVRRFKASQKQKAEACLESLTINGIPAELLRL
jgi:ATP-dependent Clp protease adapter protein ClpS